MKVLKKNSKYTVCAVQIKSINIKIKFFSYFVPHSIFARKCTVKRQILLQFFCSTVLCFFLGAFFYNDMLFFFFLVAQKICHLLGIPVVDFTKCLIRPKVKVGREYVHKSQTKDQVSFGVKLVGHC